ncbi:MAG: hypothetical protein R6X15_07960 [Pseudomonadota bacterium]
MGDKRGPAEAKVEIIEKQECYRGFFRMEKYRLRHRLQWPAMHRSALRQRWLDKS